MRQGENFLYPDRQRCFTCKETLYVAMAGLYCSYKCAGVPIPSRDLETAPRCCKRPVGAFKGFKGDTEWTWKAAYDSAADAAEELKRHSTGKQVYLCQHCLFWHIGDPPGTKRSEGSQYHLKPGLNVPTVAERVQYVQAPLFDGPADGEVRMVKPRTKQLHVDAEDGVHVYLGSSKMGFGWAERRYTKDGKQAVDKHYRRQK